MAFALLRASPRLTIPVAGMIPCLGSRPFSRIQHFSGEFAELFSPDKPHTALIMQTFDAVHDMSGLPWWGSILLGGAFLRTVTCLPLHVLSEINVAKVINARPKMAELQKTLQQKSVELSGDRDAKLKLKHLRRQGTAAVYQAENCHPLYTIICQLLQFPVWVSVSFGVRHLCGFGFSGVPPAPGMDIGGFGWMTDLTVPDPFFVLPVALFALSLANHELNNLTGIDSRMQQRGMVIFRRVVSVTVSGVICTLACFLPQGMILYWFMSSFHLLCLRILFMYPGVKRLFRVPKTPLDLERPLQTMWHNAKKYPLLNKISKPTNKEIR